MLVQGPFTTILSMLGPKYVKKTLLLTYSKLIEIGLYMVNLRVLYFGSIILA